MTRRTPVRWAAIAMTAGSRAFAPMSGGRSCMFGAARPAAFTTTCALAKASALQLFCLVDNAVYVKGAGGEAGRFNGIDADPLCVQTRNDGGTNKAAGANDFPPGFGHVFTSQKPAVGAGKNRVISTFAYLHRLW